MKTIRLAMLRCDGHAYTYAPFLQKCDPAEYYWLIEFSRPNQLIIPRLTGFQIAKVWGANRQSGRGGI